MWLLLRIVQLGWTRRGCEDILRAGIQPKLKALRVLYADKKIIIGRDELDVIKGVSQKLIFFLLGVCVVVDSTDISRLSPTPHIMQ
ncbi:hypothetical protein EDB19DRAFT_1748352 [Suillus lakei]|nr:hypothetical protein EDB19DRAFT_1748352 [Suillus lakei]